MCANYRTPGVDELREQFNLALPGPEFTWTSEVYPGGRAPFFTADGLHPGVFGLIPFFAKEAEVKSMPRRTYNARTETVVSRPSYRQAWKRRQLALVPMSAFYEPNYVSGAPVRWRIERNDGALFTAAAIWDTWGARDQPPLWSFSLLTVNADGNHLMEQFHAPGDEKRSIVIVSPDRRDEWLSTDDAPSFLRSVPEDVFTSAPDPRPSRRAAS